MLLAYNPNNHHHIPHAIEWMAPHHAPFNQLIEIQFSRMKNHFPTQSCIIVIDIHSFLCLPSYQLQVLASNLELPHIDTLLLLLFTITCFQWMSSIHSGNPFAQFNIHTWSLNSSNSSNRYRTDTERNTQCKLNNHLNAMDVSISDTCQASWWPAACRVSPCYVIGWCELSGFVTSAGDYNNITSISSSATK